VSGCNQALLPVVFDAGALGIENLLSAGQIKSDIQPICEANKCVGMAVDKHVPGALHILLLVADKRICSKNFDNPICSKPPLQGVFLEWTFAARLLDVRQLIHLGDLKQH
jgi:hypothetical protein